MEQSLKSFLLHPIIPFTPPNLMAICTWGRGVGDHGIRMGWNTYVTMYTCDNGHSQVKWDDGIGWVTTSIPPCYPSPPIMYSDIPAAAKCSWQEIDYYWRRHQCVQSGHPPGKKILKASLKLYTLVNRNSMLDHRRYSTIPRHTPRPHRSFSSKNSRKWSSWLEQH